MATSRSRQAVDELFDQVFLDRVLSSPRFDLNPTALKQFEMFRAEFEPSAPIALDEEVSRFVQTGGWTQCRISKRKFVREGDYSAAKFNEHCTVSGIPSIAHTVRIGPLTHAEWVLDRCQLTLDPRSRRILFDLNEASRRHRRPRAVVNFLATTNAASVACLG
ncbi:hypothetical protein E5720_16515 [Rhodococcus sp. PAMC28707]|uniref:hypothetical protein n=1 Tax=unclassified Rhodococcus (in: high G+C Gram-positive bacteria) TaxID=192944 RepID=UPI00109E222E|nr:MULTISPECIES: hypothetical protein [unclassified Rhodococcus (in: high G+C Gram-positive bacteria)]QCB51973.1 hypothetical protein E5769_19005 [Rhodococcus sp. PAMC28705]QCB59857.1 hypothetical protein E5720_16515 [Rhodococcus sp. PAMC28707]